MTERVARCSCGALTATCEGEPVRRSICHCTECQRRTGSAFGLQATYAVDRVRTLGESRAFTRSSDDGYWVRSHFCPVCGTTLFLELERRPGMVTIPAGAFADLDFPEPTVSVYTERQRPWLRIETSEPLVEA